MPSRMTRLPFVLLSLRPIIFWYSAGRYQPSADPRVGNSMITVGMLPLAFRHRQLATTSDKLTSERSERADNVISIFRKHSLVVNRLHGYQKGLHLTLLRPSCTQ